MTSPPSPGRQDPPPPAPPPQGGRGLGGEGVVRERGRWGEGLLSLLLFTFLLPTAAAAHQGEHLAPHDLWGAWTLDPWVLGPLGLAGWLYARGVRRLWGRAGVGRGVRRWQAGCFAAGMIALFVALVSPLDALGGVLFSAHMLQHVALMLVAAPLLVLANPVVALSWGLPRSWLPWIAAWLHMPGIRALYQTTVHPVVAWLIHALAIWIWHLPFLYQATLYSEVVHAAQHLSFFGSALLFWWAALEFSRRRRLNYGFGALYIFTTAVHSSLLGALLTFSLVLWYPVYAERTLAWGLTPLEDQQLGGLVMWVPPGVIYLAATLALLAVGLGSERGRGPARGSTLRAAGTLPPPLPQPER